jgi:hypothetical protein
MEQYFQLYLVNLRPVFLFQIPDIFQNMACIMKYRYSALTVLVRRMYYTMSRLYQPLDMIPYSEVKETKKIKKLEEISSKSARLLQGQLGPKFILKPVFIFTTGAVFSVPDPGSGPFLTPRIRNNLFPIREKISHTNCNA